MLNLSAPLIVVLGSLTGPTGAAGSPAIAPPGHTRTLGQVIRGAPPPPPPAQPIRGAPVAPPPPPAENVGVRPGYVWISGNFEWRGDRYVWMGGHWEGERRGKRWRVGRWDRQGDRYVWLRGDWMDEAPVYVPPPPPPPPAPPPPQPPVVFQPPPPPPPPTVVVQSGPPRRGFIWIPGNHEWRGNQYVWVEGHWEKERHGHHWERGRWDRDGDRPVWREGGWRREGEDGDNDRRYGDNDRRYGDNDRRYGDNDRRYGGGDRPYAAPVTITGRVVGRKGRPIAGVRVVLAGTSEGQAVTGPDGSYSFTGLRYGSYAVRPNGDGCSFAPDVVNLNNLAGPVVQDFSAACRRW